MKENHSFRPAFRLSLLSTTTTTGSVKERKVNKDTLLGSPTPESRVVTSGLQIDYLDSYVSSTLVEFSFFFFWDDLVLCVSLSLQSEIFPSLTER